MFSKNMIAVVLLVVLLFGCYPKQYTVLYGDPKYMNLTDVKYNYWVFKDSLPNGIYISKYKDTSTGAFAITTRYKNFLKNGWFYEGDTLNRPLYDGKFKNDHLHGIFREYFYNDSFGLSYTYITKWRKGVLVKTIQ